MEDREGYEMELCDHEFFFKSGISKERQEEIIKWWGTLTNDQKKMVRQLQENEIDNYIYDNSEA
jgi:late competence protein required for DNA uptake (superfamily II DNA/RNA helicase)